MSGKPNSFPGLRVNRLLGKTPPLWGIMPINIFPFALFGLLVLTIREPLGITPVNSVLLFITLLLSWMVLTRDNPGAYLARFRRPPFLYCAGQVYQPLVGSKDSVKPGTTRHEHRQSS